MTKADLVEALGFLLVIVGLWMVPFVGPVLSLCAAGGLLVWYANVRSANAAGDDDDAEDPPLRE